jgi:hypothetical protein
LIFKIKIAIEDLIEQITNWGLIWTSDMFLAPFLLNETTCFVQNGAVSSTVHLKKRAETVPFWRHCGSSSSPGRVKQGKKNIFSSPVSHRLPFPDNPKRRRPRTLYLHSFPRVRVREERCP